MQHTCFPLHYHSECLRSICLYHLCRRLLRRQDGTYHSRFRATIPNNFSTLVSISQSDTSSNIQRSWTSPALHPFVCSQLIASCIIYFYSYKRQMVFSLGEGNVPYVLMDSFPHAFHTGAYRYPFSISCGSFLLMVIIWVILFTIYVYVLVLMYLSTDTRYICIYKTIKPVK